MTKEIKTSTEPQSSERMDVSNCKTTFTPKRKRKSKVKIDFKPSRSSSLDELEQIEDTSEEMEAAIHFFCEIVLPLYKILFYSKVNDNICDYIDMCNKEVPTKRNKKRAAILDISSEQVFDILINYRERRYVEELLYHYYPNVNEFETLKGCLKSNDKSLFCQSLAEYNKIGIYELCRYYLNLERKFRSFDLFFCINSQTELDDYLNEGLAWSPFLMKMPLRIPSDNNFTPLSLLKTDVSSGWVEDKVFSSGKSRFDDFAVEILSCIKKLKLNSRYRKKFDELLKNPKIEFLYRCTTSPSLLYGEEDVEEINNGPKDILFCAEIDDITRRKLIELIVAYFKEPLQQQRCAKNEVGFTILTRAQKSVVTLLKSKKLLHHSIDTRNAKKSQLLTSLFIKEKVGGGNVGDSNRYNNTQVFQDYDPDKLKESRGKYKKYIRFTEFMSNFEEIINNG